MRTLSLWHPLSVSGNGRTGMVSWACPDGCPRPCPLIRPSRVVEAAVDALPAGRYLMRWTGDRPEIIPAAEVHDGERCEVCRICAACDVTVARIEDGRLLCETCHGADEAAALEAFMASGWRDRQPDLTN